jgi:hypothetical protein
VLHALTEPQWICGTRGCFLIRLNNSTVTHEHAYPNAHLVSLVVIITGLLRCDDRQGLCAIMLGRLRKIMARGVRRQVGLVIIPWRDGAMHEPRSR